jgi:transaldolase
VGGRGGSDGFVSVEVSPAVANDAEATAAEVRSWIKRIDRDNLLVKVPATNAGTVAFERVTAEGVSINVTLIFSLDRYRAIAEAYISGLESFLASGGDISRVHSVASFFVSRIDTEVDARLKKLAAGGSGE